MGRSAKEKAKKAEKKARDKEEKKARKKKEKKARKKEEAKRELHGASESQAHAAEKSVNTEAEQEVAKQRAREAADSLQTAQLLAAVNDIAAQLKAVVAVVSELKSVVEKTGSAMPPKRSPPSPPVKRGEMPAVKKVWIHARYKMNELSFHTQIWREMGMEVTQAAQCSDWTVRWSMRLQPQEWESFQPWHKTNFIPGVVSLIRKDNLHKSIVAMQRRFGSESFDFWPESFNLPDEWNSFADSAGRQPHAAWILKPPASSCGRRIRVASSFTELGVTPRDDWVQTHRPLAQRYIDTPLLDGHKFTFRVYVVLTGVDPLRVYIYGDGLTRIASRKYSKDKASFDDPFVHLDSIDVNVNNVEPVEFKIPTLETEGLRSTIMRTLDHFAATERIDKARVWRDIETVIVKSVLCAEGDMLQAVRSYVKHRGSAFDLLGYDILLDKEFKPWIIEINHSPSMAPLTVMENRVKHAMLSDYFRLVDVAQDDRESLREMTAKFVASVKKLGAEEGLAAYKLHDFAKLEEEQRVEAGRLSEQDCYTLVNRFLEMSRRGGFECAFPCLDMLERYGSFYRKNRNVLHQVWTKERRTIQPFLQE